MGLKKQMTVIRKATEEIDLAFMNLTLICKNTKIYSKNDTMRSGWLGRQLNLFTLHLKIIGKKKYAMTLQSEV